MEFNIKQNFFDGDLCYVKGYGNSTWEVIGYSLTKDVLRGKVDEYIIYTFSNVHTGEDIIAFNEDLTLVCRAKHAYEYIRQLDKTGSPPKVPVNNTRKEKATMRMQLTKKQVNDLLDELLDRYNDVQRFIKADGEITEHSKKQLEAIMSDWDEINKLTVVDDV